MKKELSLEELKFQNGQGVNENGQPVLGHLEGPCADFLSPTRNGRLYSEEVWEKVFQDPITLEYFENGGIFGELGHPDREEVDLEKVAVCMPKVPEKDSDGKFIGKFDILNTPCGRILRTLCDYGYRLGISSRGNGELETDFDGREAVVPNSYRLSAFDIVTLPAVKEARLDFTESLNTTVKKPLYVALTEALQNATEDEQLVMKATLKELEIDYTPEEEALEVDNTIEDIEEVDAAIDDGAKILDELQKALEEKLALEEALTEANRKLSVCYAKEKELKETLAQSENQVKQLSESAKRVEPLKRRIAGLEESLQTAKADVESVTSNSQQTADNLKGKLTNLNENLKMKETALKDATTQRVKLEEQLTSLKGEVSELKSDSAIKHKEYQGKLQSANKLIEGYKKIASNAVNRYIDSQAHILGVSVKDIKSKLNEKYTIEDVDQVCEDLREYRLNLSALPFSVDSKKRVKITESKESPLVPSPYDDTVDPGLFDLLKQ